jgi:hypothetical protein
MGADHMSFQIIKKMPVFLNGSRYDLLNEGVFKGKDELYRFKSSFSDEKEGKESRKKLRKILEEKYKNDPKGFYREWVCFDIVEKDASETVTILIIDWCQFYGSGTLVDLRDFKERLMDEVDQPPWLYPFGKNFILQTAVHPLKNQWKLLLFQSKPATSVLIKTDSVYRLTGDISKFTLLSKDYTLLFNKGI